MNSDAPGGEGGGQRWGSGNHIAYHQFDKRHQADVPEEFVQTYRSQEAQAVEAL
jgi:hypothetical protein